jgi:hypothetical protein
MMLQMQTAAGATGHAGGFHPQQQQQQQPQYFQPVPPGYGRPGSASSVSTLGSGGPLAPLADAQQRSARLQRKVIAAEQARLQKSELLLRPLRSLPDSTQPPPHSMAPIIPSFATSSSSSSSFSSPSTCHQQVPAFHHANLAQLHTPSALASQSHSRSESRVSERSAAASAPHARAQQQPEQQPAPQQQQQPPPPPPVIAANPEPIFVLRKAQPPAQTHGDEKES